MPIFKFKDEIYGANITFIYDADNKTIISYLKKQLDHDCSEICENSNGFFVGVDEHNFYIVITEHAINWLATLTHECMHVTSKILRARGIPLNDTTEEAYAYYIAWMFNTCGMRAVDTKNAKKKAKAKAKAKAKKV